MPRVVDHDQRREQIAEAMWQVVRREGFAGVSVRSVAREARHSPSSLRYYFTTQAELLEFALTSLLVRTRRRIETHLTTFDPESDLVPWFAEMFKEGLPLDDEREAEVEVWIALHKQARFNDRLTKAARHEWNESHQLCRLAVAILADRRFTPDATRSLSDRLEREATLLRIFWGGMVFEARSRPEMFSTEVIDELFHTYLRELELRLAKSTESSTEGGW